MDSGRGCIQIETPDAAFDNFINHWLPRQVFYHGDVNRLSTDPQTRNYLQDNLGMAYIAPEVTRKALLHALGQAGRHRRHARRHPARGRRRVEVHQPGAAHRPLRGLPVCLQGYLTRRATTRCST